jgi:hypothetical protein
LKRLSLLLFFMMTAFGTASAWAVGPVNTPFGGCVGGATDCTTATGHASISFASTLTINEQRSVSFGTVAIACGGGSCDGLASIDLGLDGSRTPHSSANDIITLLGGGSGAQSPGHYTVEGANEGNATQVYITFADNVGSPVDFSGENYHPGGAVTLSGPGGNLSMDKFVINQSGSDVYGHYIDNRGGANTPAPGIGNPFDHAHAANPLDVDVVVGATLHTVAGQNYTAGKYIGTFNITVSY